MERQERYDEKLIQILRSACSIFAEKGFHHATVRDVAAATGVSPAGLYYYFKSKEELLFLILENTLRGLLEAIRAETTEARDPVDLLKGIARAHLFFMEENRNEMRVLAQEWGTLSGPSDQEVKRVMRGYSALMIRTLRRLSPERSTQELRAAAFGLFGMLSWVDRWYAPEEDLPMDQLAEELSNLFLGGFLTEGAEVPVFMRLKEDQKPGKKPRETPGFAILSGPGF